MPRHAPTATTSEVSVSPPDVVEPKRLTDARYQSGAETSPLLTLAAVAALDDCTRPQRLNTSWKQGSRPGTSYFCMPRRVLLAPDLGNTPPLDSPPAMTNVKTAYLSSRKGNRKFYGCFS